MRTFGLVQNAISLVSYGGAARGFSPWAVAVLLLAGLPAFIAEAKFSGDAFRLFRWRSPETRMQIYLETVLAREDHAKEVKLFGLGPRLLQRYRDIFGRSVSRGSRAHHPARCLGLRLGLIGTACALRRLRLDRARHRARAHHARADDHVSGAVPPGTVRGVGELSCDRRHVRGQPLPVDALRVSGNARAGAEAGESARGPASRGRRALRECELQPIPERPSRPRAMSRCTCVPGRVWRWWARTARARPRSSSC
jgi:hypothetical protein